MNFWPRFPNLFRLERGPFANKVTPAPSTSPKQQLRKEIPAFHVNKNNGRGNFHFNLGKNLGGKSLQTPQAKDPLFMRPPTNGRILQAGVLSRTLQESAPFTLDLTRLNGLFLQGLPPHLHRLTFDNSSHALCFIRAAIAGDYNTAQIIACSKNNSERTLLSKDLPRLNERWWREHGRVFFKEQIEAHKFVERQPASFTLDLREIADLNCKQVPEDLHRLTFSDDTHALFFMKAVCARDYEMARCIHRSVDRDYWSALTSSLPEGYKADWNTKRLNVKDSIAEQQTRNSRSSMPAQLKRQSPRSSFTLNLMDMDSQTLRNLPPSLRQLEFHNNYHARCFIKAALAGSRTGDYSWAEGIANSHDKNHWKSLSSQLRGFDAPRWDNGGRDFFEAQINKQQEQSRVNEPAFNPRAPWPLEQVWKAPYKDVPRLSATLTQVETANGPVTCFYDSDSPLSNWYPSPFRDENNIHYSCVEQYLFAEKFRLLGMEDARTEVMSARGPEAQKAVSNKYPMNPEQLATWIGFQDSVLQKGNELKYAYNPHLLDVLLLTKGPLLEAAKKDRVYGTGAAVSDPTGMHAIKTGSWTGQNKLGNTLTRIRDASLAEFPGYQYRLDTLRGQYNPETF